MKKILALILALCLVLSTVGFTALADETLTPTEGYMLYIYNADGTVGMEIDGTKSVSDFSLRSAIADARVFVDNAFLFGITTPATYVVEMYEDSTEDESFEIGSDVTVNGNGHSIVLADGVELINNGTFNDVKIVGGPAVAKVGDVEYSTIDEAIANWTANTTLTLLDDVQLSDVISLKSTEHHILNLGTYTLTAASGKNAIEITCNGLSNATYCLTVNADTKNGGGITAPGKACIYYKKTVSTKDRPIITINGGVFNGSYSVNSNSSNKGTNCPQYVFKGGIFNGNINLSNAMMIVYDGTFHGWINCTGDVSAYRLIAGGTFKQFQFLTSGPSGNEQKLTFGSAKNNMNADITVDKDGYYVVSSNADSKPDYEAIRKPASNVNSYFTYSNAVNNGLYYEKADDALAKTNKGTLSLYADSNVTAKPSGSLTIDCSSGAVYSGDIEFKNASASFKIILPADGEYNGTVKQNGNSYIKKTESTDDAGNKVVTFEQITDVKDYEVSLIRNGSYTVYSFNDALEVAVPGDTIKVLDHIDTLVVSDSINTTKAISTFATGNEIIIDLNGKTLSVSDPSIPAFINGETYIIKNGTIIGDVVNNGGELTIEDVDVQGDLIINAGTADFTGGSVTGSVVSTDIDALDITGGKFKEDPSAYVADGYDVIRHADYYEVKDLSKEAKSISVEFVKTDIDGTDKALEGKDTYNIVLKANDGDIINDLASADLTFNFDDTPVNGGAMAYSIVAADDMTLTKIGDRYMFNYSGAPVYEEEGTSIVIGELTIEGYGSYTFSTVGKDKKVKTNIVNATTFYDNLVDYYVEGGDVDTDASTGGLIISGTASNTIAVPTRELTVKVTFPNVVKDNGVDYQNMKVEITGNIDGVNQTVTYELGDGKYTVTEDRLVLHEAYTVTVSGDGYRTARYTVTMTGDKTLNFWNNVMDNAMEVEEGKASSAAFKNFLAGDIVADNNINIYDLSAVVSYFTQDAKEDAKYIKYDLNRDGVIDSKDVAYVLVSWGE